MTKRITAILLALSICLTALSHSIAGEESLRSTLERTWQTHLQASKSGNESELQKTVSSFRLGTMKNNLAAAKRSLTPDIIKSISEHAPDISKSEFVTLLEKDATAGLVYVKDSEEKDATRKPRVTFTFIKFVKETSGWKVDVGMNIGRPKFQDNGEKTEFDTSDLPPTYEIDGKVLPPPNPITPPYASAFLDVFCPGYKTHVTVNGVEQATTVDKSHSGLLQGGLRKGKNSIVITVSRVKEDAVFEPTVTVRRILETRKMEKVFNFEPKTNIEGKHTLTFKIDEN